MEFAKQAGVEISWETDFSHLHEVASKLDGRGGVQPAFDHTRSETGSINGFWLKGVDAAGSVVHLQAFRQRDFVNVSLNDHLREFVRLYALDGAAIDVGSSEVCETWLTRAAVGSGCYHGEVWIAPSFRKRGLGHILPRMGVAYALLRFQPAFVYGLISSNLIEKNFALKHGYCHVDPVPFVWRGSSGEVVQRDYLCFGMASEIMSLFRDDEMERRIPPAGQAASLG